MIRRVLGSALVSFLMLFASSISVYAATPQYVTQQVSPTGDGIGTSFNYSVIASEGNRFISSISDAGPIYYYDGQTNTRITPDGESPIYYHASLYGNFVVYTEGFNTCTSPSPGTSVCSQTESIVRLYNTQTGTTQQLIDTSAIIPVVTIGNGYVAWLQQYPDSNPNDYQVNNVVLYDMATGAQTQLTSNADQWDSSSQPVFDNGNLYWLANHRSSSTDQIASTTIDAFNLASQELTTTMAPTNPSALLVNNDRVVVVGADQKNLYLQNGNTSTEIFAGAVEQPIGTDDENIATSLVQLQGNLLVWLSTVNGNYAYELYNFTNSSTQILGTISSYALIGTDGRRVVYMYADADGNMQPAILDTQTSQTSYVSTEYSMSHSYSGPMRVAVADGFVALTGWLANNPYSGWNIYVSKLTNPPGAATGLIAASPTNQHPSLSWDAVPGAVSYNVYRAGTLTGNTSNTNYIDNPGQDGTYSYTVTAIDAYGLESDPSAAVSVTYDTTPPSGAFSGSTIVVRLLLNQQITGTATDSLSGVARVEISSGSTTLSSSSGGAITLSCNTSNTSCTWTASPTNLTTGSQTLTLRVTDAAGNVYTATKSYTII